MTYDNIYPARFIDRPNRFIANVLIEGERQVCHVKNTGRCRELLTPDAKVYVQRAANPGRKTAWDLIAVQKGTRLINMDSSAPNAVFKEWLQGGGLGEITYIKPECTHGDSRFDFYFESHSRCAFCEVKGVTLENEGVVRFPDAPTLRGVKHLDGLARCVGEGYEAYAVFIIQMDDVKFFGPNWVTHADFGHALRRAEAAGVKILALDCTVTPDSITARAPVAVMLD